MKRALVNVFCFCLTWVVWLWLASRQLDTLRSLAVAVVGTLLIVPLVFAGRSLLDRQPTVDRAEWVTLFVHYFVAIFFGSAIIAAVDFGLNAPNELVVILPEWLTPLLPVFGLGIMVIGGGMLLYTVFNLAVKGLGAPFAIALTRLVVTDWIYAWTRNPMILSALAFLIGLGLWLRSGLFLVWVLVIVSPALFVFLKIYEERELEIRFGQAYLDYKAKTPRFFPRNPSQSDESYPVKGDKYGTD
jgi:protein-S-isoprenylcysteine O-methyltransferase Ste14